MFTNGRKIAFKTVAGSVNRNLNDENSDLDYKIFVLPSFEELYEGKVYKSFTTSNEEDIEIHDIRKLEKLLYNSNLTYLELFFSLNVKLYGYEEILELFMMREELPRINLKALYNSCLGMFNGQMKNLQKENSLMRESIINKYGYNTKKAMMAMHFLKFITKYYKTDFRYFGMSIWYTDEERDFMLSIKNGAYNYDDIMKLLDEELKRAESLKSIYHSFDVDEKTYKQVKSLLRKLVKNNIINSITANEK